MPPPTIMMPSSSSANSMLGMPPYGTNPNSGASASGVSEAYDPLAALMAPPARKIPSVASMPTMPNNTDPLAAMMAPPPAFGLLNSTSNNNGATATAGPPAFKIWQPPKATPLPLSTTQSMPELTTFANGNDSEDMNSHSSNISVNKMYAMPTIAESTNTSNTMTHSTIEPWTPPPITTATDPASTNSYSTAGYDLGGIGGTDQPLGYPSLEPLVPPTQLPVSDEFQEISLDQQQPGPPPTMHQQSNNSYHANQTIHIPSYDPPDF